MSKVINKNTKKIVATFEDARAANGLAVELFFETGDEHVVINA